MNNIQQHKRINRRTVFSVGKSGVILLYSILFCFSFPLVSIAQNPVLHTIADKNEILIGDQFHVKVTAEFIADRFDINWLSIPDSMAHFELISTGKLDSVYTGNKLTGYSQNFVFTSFDSGKWNLPGFKIRFEPKSGDAPVTLYSDTIPVTVSYAVADSTDLLRDIKPVKAVEVESNFLFYLIAACLLILILIVAYLLYRKWKNKKNLPRAIPKKDTYETALKALENLKQTNLQDPEQIKGYHTQLAQIFKAYLSETYGQNYLSKTTGDVLIAMKNTEPVLLSDTAAALRSCDAVKFAKYLPGATESELSFNSIYKAVVQIQQQLTTKNV